MLFCTFLTVLAFVNFVFLLTVMNVNAFKYINIRIAMFLYLLIVHNYIRMLVHAEHDIFMASLSVSPSHCSTVSNE